ncbi:MAG: BON domain-containing protein [Sedimenticolaceae bacterium]|jgi:osmotically-inducible protein OsmY
MNSHTSRISLRILIALVITSLLSGCAAVVVGAGTTGATVAHDRRTTGTYVEDKAILLKALQMRSQDEVLQKNSNISIEVYNLQILLTGQAIDADIVARFRDKLLKIDRVKHVYNEVTVGAEGTWSEAAADTLLTSRVKVELFNVGIQGFDPLRVKVTSSLGTVYLMGLLTPEEADAVVEKVRYISGVKRVVRLFEYID